MSTNIGDDTKKSLHELLQSLRRDRERLAVQLNLGKKELRDEWETVEDKWEDLEKHLAEFTEDARDAAHRVSDEISDAYRRLTDILD